jgi:hypothetical protein
LWRDINLPMPAKIPGGGAVETGTVCGYDLEMMAPDGVKSVRFADILRTISWYLARAKPFVSIVSASRNHCLCRFCEPGAMVTIGRFVI